MHNYFKKILILQISIFVILNLNAQNNDSLKINGHIKWLKDGTKLVLEILENNADGNIGTKLIDTCRAQNGSFNLKGKIFDGPRVFFLRFGENSDAVFTHLYASNEKITIEDSEESVPKRGYISQYLKITGSPSTTAFINLFLVGHITSHFLAGYNSYINKLEDSIGYDRKLIESALIAKQKLIASMFFELQTLSKQKEYASVIPDFIWNMYTEIGKERPVVSMYNNLNTETKNSYYGKYLPNTCLPLLDNQRKTSKLP